MRTIPPFSSSVSQKGFTLTELMVGLTVSLILVAMIAQIYVGAKTTYRYQTELAGIQESGRFALELISQDAKSAGFQGCGDVGVVANVLNSSTASWWLDTSRPIRVFNLNTGFPADFSNVVTTSDAVTFIRSDSVSERLVTAHDPAAATFTVSAVPPFEQGALLLVTDCQSSAFFQMTGPVPPSPPPLIPTNVTIEHNATGADFTPGNCKNSLGLSCGSIPGPTKTFGPGSLVSRIASNAYFIAPSQSPGARNSLYTRHLNPIGKIVGTTLVEIVPGVEAMKLSYGVDDDGDLSANRFLLANDVESLGLLNRVVSMHVEILVRSQEDGLASTSQTLTFNGSSWPAPDRRIYKVFSTTLNLRNRSS